MSNQGEQDGAPMICAQCHFTKHDEEAEFCFRCGGVLVDLQSLPQIPGGPDASPSSMNSNSSSSSSSIIPSSPGSASTAVHAIMDKLEPSTKASIDFSVHLWDCSDKAFAKSRDSKHTARGMASFFAELSKIEKTYAAALAKLAAGTDYGSAIEANEIKPVDQSTVIRAWNSVKADVISRSTSHANFSEALSSKVEVSLTELRKTLSSRKEKLESMVIDAQQEMKRALENHAKFKVKYEKLQADLASKGPSGKLTQADVSQACDVATQAQMVVFQTQNNYNRTVSENLTRIQELELERLDLTRRILFQARMAQSEMERKYLRSESAEYQSISSIDPVKEVSRWIEMNKSMNACPWASQKDPHSSISAVQANAAANVGKNIFAIAGREAEPVSVSSSSSSAATTSPTIAAGVSGANEAAAEASKPRPTVRRRGSRSNSAQVSAETAALLHSSNPIINELALPPSNAVSALPAGIGMTDIPFPSLSDGANKSMEPLPTTPWMPTVRALFPMEVASGLPEIRHLQLDDSEYNRMIYEQLLLGTKLLSGVEASSQLDTIVQVVRVQLQITQGEHDLLLLLLNSEQSHTAAMPKSVPAPTKEVYDSMKFVNYRINLLKNTRSSKFSSLQLYCKWFQRQLMAIWLSIMWSMAMEAQESSAAAAPGGSSGSQPTLSLLRFKQNLQVVQLLGFCLQSRIETKLFVFGDSVKSGGHDDLVAQLDSLEQTLNSFPRAEKKSGGLTYPQAFLNKAYQHLLKMTLVSGGDDAGRPIVSEKRKKALLKKKKAAQKAANKKNNNQHAGEEDDDEEEEEEKENDDEEEDEEDEITEDEDEDDDDESQIELNDNYATIIASLSSVRTAWHISSFVHHVSTLSVCLHLMYYQSQDYDGRLLDAEGMLTEDEHSLLPLIISSTEGIAGRLSTSDSKAHGLSSALQKEAGTKPSGGYHSEEYKWLFYGLRNISMALSDFHKFPAAPVVACLSFYYDVTHWLGVKDSAKRVENLLRISTTTFYQTLIPTEQIISFNGALGGGDRRKSKENSLQVPEKFARPSGGSMKLEAKKMLNWTSMEWKRYTQKLANFVREQIEDLFPLLAKNKSLAAVFGSGGGSASSSSSAAKKGKADKQKNPFDSEEDDDENSGEEGEEEGKRGSTHSRPSSASSSSSKMNGAELCVTHILRCFQHDVHLLTADRKAQTSIMDDTLFSLVNSSMKLQSVLLDGDYHAFWSGEGVRITVGTVFPNLQELCASNLKRWISVQRVKVEGIRERCVSLDTWSAMDMASGLRYSHSVKDLFNFLSTVEEAFWAHARSMQGYGVSDSFPVLFDLFQSTMIQYALQIVETAGLDVMNSLLPTKDVKLKMAKIEPDSKDKAKAFMKGLFKSKEEKEEEESQVTPLPVSKGLVLQTIPSLCVRLNSIQAAIDNTEELTSSIRSHLQAFVDDCPIVAPPNSDKSTMDAYNRAQKRWSSWTPHFKPPTRLQRMDGENLFTDAAEQMEHSIDTLSNGIGFAKVYIDWRHAWLERLYKPQPTYSNRIKEGEIEVQIEESMPIIHGSVDRKLFPLVARHIFTHLLDAIEYTLLYGRRCMPEDSVRNIVNDDIAQLLTLFGHACPKSQLEDICKELQAVCQTMESVSSEDLISAYQSQKAPNNLTLAKVARILATRNNKNAQKFCDKLRGK